jgi:integrase
MARKQKKQRKNNVPGSLYQRNSRWWWKVQLPGEKKCKNRPLKPVGARFATSDFSVACEVAENLWQQAVYQTEFDGRDIDVTHIASLTARYLHYVDGYYINSKEPQDIRYSLKPLTAMYGCLPVAEFGPLKLIDLRDHMIALDWSRKLINQRMGRIKRMFKWAVSRQMVSPVVYQGLMTVEGLKYGRSAARENPKRKPVAEQHVYAVLGHTTPVVAAMIELQLLTGMRPGEMVAIRPCDIERPDGAIWHYCPEKHKNQHRGIERIVAIGPRGQELLRPFLLRLETDYCFSPAESEKMRREKLTEYRKTPGSCGNIVGSNRKEAPAKKPGLRYDSTSYAKAVKSAITACNKPRRAEAKAAEAEPVLVPKWTPYQLRHTAATKVRKEMGYECAGATLGHTNMSATAIYAERNQGLADEAAKRFG